MGRNTHPAIRRKMGGYPEVGKGPARLVCLQTTGSNAEPRKEAKAMTTTIAARATKAGSKATRERFDVIVIGAGQAGLSVGYHLAKRGVRFVILDAGARVGDVWRKRWDSLRLFTPAKFDGLAGMPFPAPGEYYPTKDEMGDYLEAYATKF